MEQRILVVNPGSSSRKYAIYDGPEPLIQAHYEHEGGAIACTVIWGDDEDSEVIDIQLDQALSDFINRAETLVALSPNSIDACGVRVVVPGRNFLEHHHINDKLITILDNYQNRAPLHISVALQEIKIVQQNLSNASLYAISDSEFHKTLSHEARNYAIKRSDADEYDVYRFGFHGLSTKSVVRQLAVQGIDPPRLAVCHLGSGSSVTAVKRNQSVDTSMGYSPLEGLIMATRSGSIDVAAALEIKKRKQLDDIQLLDYLNNQSGLIGLSENSNDIRELLVDESDSENARLALSAMVHRIQHYIGAYTATLGGIDALVFTGTVGERSAIIRERVCASLASFGVELDSTLNNNNITYLTDISSEESGIPTYVVVSDEMGQIAREVGQFTQK